MYIHLYRGWTVIEVGLYTAVIVGEVFFKNVLKLTFGYHAL